VLHLELKVRHFTASNHTITFVIAIVLALAMGYVLEGLGAEIEDRWDTDHPEPRQFGGSTSNSLST